MVGYGIVSNGVHVLVVGELATKVMGYEEGKVGEIIQIFKNTAYVRTLYDDLVCITSNKIRGPMNMNVEDIEFSGINLHDPVYKEGDVLRIHNSILSAKNALVYRARRQFIASEGLQERVISAADAVATLGIKGSILDSESYFFNTFSQSIGRIARSSAKEDSFELQKGMRSLIGLGNGATPSGDDFLAGFLFCLRTIAGEKSIRDLTFKINNETSWYSRKFIEYAQDGFVIEPVENFASILFSASKEGMSESIHNLLTIGHSSGIDAALGVMFATTFGKESEYCEVLLEKFGFKN